MCNCKKININDVFSFIVITEIINVDDFELYTKMKVDKNIISLNGKNQLKTNLVFFVKHQVFESII